MRVQPPISAGAEDFRAAGLRNADLAHAKEALAGFTRACRGMRLLITDARRRCWPLSARPRRFGDVVSRRCAERRLIGAMLRDTPSPDTQMASRALFRFIDAAPLVSSAPARSPPRDVAKVALTPRAPRSCRRPRCCDRPPPPLVYRKPSFRRRHARAESQSRQRRGCPGHRKG